MRIGRLNLGTAREVVVNEMTKSWLARETEAEEAANARERARLAAVIEAASAEWRKVVPPLEAAEAKARAKVEELERSLSAARELHGLALGALAAKRGELSFTVERAHNEAAEVAPSALERFRAELLELQDELRRGHPSTMQIGVNALTVSRKFRTDATSREARAVALIQALRRADAVRREPGADVEAAIREIRESIPAVKSEIVEVPIPDGTWA
jgi:hypothetical protein